MSGRPTDVLFIAGAGRSGSTLLDCILGQVEGQLSLGELHYIWDRGLVENQLCGCGTPFRNCKFWNAVITEAFGDFENVDYKELNRLKEFFFVRRNRIQLLVPGLRTSSYKGRLKQYSSALSKLYGAIKRVSGCDLIIDSSKVYLYALLLNSVPDIKLHVIHLVRDSRAVAYSWQREKLRPEIREGNEFFPRFSLVNSSLRWNSSYIHASALRYFASYQSVSYEDLVNHPGQTVSSIMAHIGKRGHKLDFMNERTVYLKANHSVSGNPSRFNQGAIEIRVDNEWKEKMTRSQIVLVTSLTFPFLLKQAFKNLEKEHNHLR
jgi:hypothetical protein